MTQVVNGSVITLQQLAALLSNYLASNPTFINNVNAAFTAGVAGRTTKPSTAGTLWNSGNIVEISDGSP